MALREGDPGGATGATGPGGYEIIEELGRGGMGVVYRARQPGLQREVALKVLLDGPFAAADARRRFRREAAAAAALRHVNIVTIHEVGETDGHPFLSMELVEGETLASLTRAGPLEPRRAAGYLLLVARAIAAAHAHGVLHRDLKPGNIIVDRDDQPRITDFGLATRLDADPAQTRHLAGSPGYLPPEQADPAAGPTGVTADVYALGATLYHLLTGRPPFAAASVTATLKQVLEDEPAPLRRLNSQVPRDLETICLKCLRKDPAQRYPGTDALADDLLAFLDQRPIQARPVTPFERVLLWSRRRPAIAALSAALALALIGGVITTAWQWRHNQRQLYAADLRVASEALAQGDLGLARDLLELHRPAAGRGDFAWRLLQKLSAGDARTLLGEHPWIVGAIAWSADGRQLASASVPSGTVAGDLRLWKPAQPATPGVVGCAGFQITANCSRFIMTATPAFGMPGRMP
jgi:eukaryotic-like serine/threonine-protein kinase